MQQNPRATSALPDRLSALVPEYLRAREADVETLANAMEAGKFCEVSHIAHRIKGTGSSYGFPRLTELAARLEQAAESRDEALCRSFVAQLRELVALSMEI